MNRVNKYSNRLRQTWTATLPDHCIGVSWSNDGQLVAAAAISGPVNLIHARSGAITATLPGHRFGTAAVAWQPNGSLLATAGQDGHARLWDANGAEVAVLAGGSAWVERLAWSHDGAILATAAGKKVRLWNTSGVMLREYANHGSTVADLAWQPRTNVLTVAAYGGIAHYDATQAEPIRRFEWKGSPLVIAWAPNGKMLAHGNQDATVHFWYIETGVDLHMSGYPTKVRELSWDYSGRFLATGGGEAVCVWDCSGKGPEGTKPQMLEGHDKLIAAVAWQRRGFFIASAGLDGRVNLWQPANKKDSHVGHDRITDAEATVIAWSPDDNSLVVGDSTGGVRLFRV